jgi:hypothetical protein
MNKKDKNMKRYGYSLMSLIMVCFLPCVSTAEDFLGAPLIPSAEITLKKTDRMEMTCHLSHDQVIAFYQESLKGYPDIKFREWKEATYIEDDGKLAWHSITVSKGDPSETTIVIVKDNWTWIIGTLIIRYIGVFVVLVVLLLGMSISGNIISRSIKKMETQKKAGD